MSILTPDRVEITATIDLPLNEPHVAHVTCHCNMNRAWCGADITNEGEAPEGTPGCWLCEVMEEMYIEECPRGCRCVCDEQHETKYYCGICICEDEEDED